MKTPLGTLRHHVTGAIERGETAAIVEQKGETTMDILSIDAWRDGSGWTWNNWHKRGSAPLSVADLSPRRMLAWLRSEGYLDEYNVAIEDDQYNVVIVRRGTREPILALAYGAAV